MLTQTVLPFKLESTDEVLTAHAGLALLGEFAKGIGLPRWVESAFDRPGSAVGYGAWDHLQPLILMLHGGGRSLEDLRRVREDRGLLDLLRIQAVPSSDAAGDWLRRQGVGTGLVALDEVNRRMIGAVLRTDERTEYTLDIDASQIVAEKEAAAWTYKGERGYMPMVGHLAENGLVVGMSSARVMSRQRPGTWSSSNTVQADLFEKNGRYRYTVIASNRTEAAPKVFDWYCQRGDASENRIKELKIGFGMERMPCGQFAANALFFRIGVLAYNLFIRFKHSALSPEWHRHQVQTLRWRLYQAAGRIVRHAGQLYLKVSEGMRALYQSVRERTWETATSGMT